MLNSCTFTGRFAADPNYYEGEKGARVTFTLAVDRDRKNADGQYDTDFLDFVAWGGTASFISRYFHKGDLATVSNARAQVRSYTSSDGAYHRRVEFSVDTIYFGQRKKSENFSG